MKVIKEPVLWKIEEKCTANKNYDGGCGAILEINADDIYMYYDVRADHSQGDYEYYIHSEFLFKCPCCGKENLIDSNKIPNDVGLSIINAERNQIIKKKALRNAKY